MAGCMLVAGVSHAPTFGADIGDPVAWMVDAALLAGGLTIALVSYRGAASRRTL